MKPSFRMLPIFLSIFLLCACATDGGVQVTDRPATPVPNQPTKAAPVASQTPQIQPTTGATKDGSQGEAVPLVKWQRSGGIAGRCRQFIVFPDGSYLYSDCLEQTTLSQGQLSADQWSYLTDLAKHYGSFRWESRPPKQSADMFLDWFLFNGNGTATPNDQQMQDINNQLALMTSKLNSTQMSQGSGIYGQVVINPACPGPIRDGETECSEKPYQTKLAILDVNGNLVVEVQSGADGVFQVALQPGIYTIRSLSEKRFPVAADQTITITNGQYITVTIQFDSGMR